jgi:RNA polymerase sigma factor (sigma-70 family)
MAQIKVGSTDPRLLKRVAVLSDDPAWVVFYTRYDPVVRAWCAGYRLDSESVDELRQRIWVELARRMPTYQYDPGGSFRGWLRRLCHHRAIDLYRERHTGLFESLNDDHLWVERNPAGASDDTELEDDEAAAGKLVLLEEAREVQEHVRRKVKPVRWEVFWRVVIEGEPLSDTAASLGLKYATAYAAARHVATLLRAEGRQRRARPPGEGQLTPAEE